MAHYITHAHDCVYHTALWQLQRKWEFCMIVTESLAADMDCVNAVGKSQLRLYRRHVLCFCQTQSSGGNEEKDTGSGLCRPLHPHLLLPSLSVPTRLTECGRPSSRWSVLPVLMRMSVIRSTMQWGSETPPTNRCICFPHAVVWKHCCYIEAGNSGEKRGGLCCVYSTVLYLCLIYCI